MRTNIEIDQILMMSVLQITNIKTKKEDIEQGLKLLLRLKQQENIKSFIGKLGWDADLDEMRN